MRFLFSPILVCVLSTCFVIFDGHPVSAGADEATDLQREIRSILSNRCFACHGPDQDKIEAGLRLDQLESATSVLESGSIAIVPGKPDESEMMNRILATDDSVRMPPPAFGDRLTEREATLLRTWITQGAPLSKHWSFLPPQKPPLPEIPLDNVSNAGVDWIRSPIDSFALAKMMEKGLSPGPQADRWTLLRRWSLDLTGLPPSLEDQHAFLGDESPTALENAVDRLLASPQYGEHWARKWLDLARYADSAGYADDPARTIWAYRDWVIQALNRDIPFDQFTIEQLAGDLLPNPTPDQWIATAFHRNTLTNNEGGTNDEEFRNVAIVDRVNTTMAVWMGVTMACAQCHNHKYDPISQAEYYRVFALFNQSQDADRTDESPRYDVYTEEQVRQRQNWEREIERLKELLHTPDPSLASEQLAFEAHLQNSIPWQTWPVEKLQVHSASPSNTKEDAPSKELSTPVATDVIAFSSTSDTDSIAIEFPLREWNQLSANAALQAIQIETLPDSSLPGGGAGLAGGNFVLSRAALELVAVQPQALSEAAASRDGAKYVRIELPGENKILSLAEVEIVSLGKNVARSGKASQSSTDYGGEASRAIDGNSQGDFNKNSTTHTASSSNPWWEVELASPAWIERIQVFNRTDGAIHERLNGAVILTLDSQRKELWRSTIDVAQRGPMTRTVVPTHSIPLSSAYADYAQDGFAPSGVLDSDPHSGWAVGGAIPSPHHLRLLVDNAAWSKTVSDLSPEDWLVRLRLEFQSKYAKHILARFRIGTSTAPFASTILSTPENILAIARTDRVRRSKEDSAALADYYQSQVAPSMNGTRSRLAELEAAIAAMRPATSVPIMKNLATDQQRETYVHVRGNYRAKGETVTFGLPSIFHPLRHEGPQRHDNTAPNSSIDRLDLARWLMQSDNPLTARVTVNRIWETLFGLGLVRTTEEFGSQGDLPSHPELLDWLATEWMHREWNTKSFLREIVLSSTYMQQSNVTIEKLERDSENVYLSRGPRFRLTAEQVRDQALSVGGLLSFRMYGEPVKPRQPKMGLSAAFGSGTDWETSSGENSYRRGLYTTWRRSNPYPSMATFDAPNREVCTLKRDRTNTPLQALVTLNDPVFVEAAQGLARRIVLRECAALPLDDRLRNAFQIVLGRLPIDRELSALRELHRRCREQYSSDPTSALQLATDPLGPLPNGADTVELATWTTIGNVLMNLDEVLMTR